MTVNDWRAAGEATAVPEPSTARRWTVYVLLALSCFAIAMSMLVVWAHRTVLSTDGWVETVGEVFADPEVVASVSQYGSEQIVVALDVEDRAAEALPAAMRFLAAPITAAAQEFAAEALNRVMSDPGFEDLWVEANRVLHKTALKVLRGEADKAAVYPDGSVRLNLFPVIDRAINAIDERTQDLVRVNTALPELSDPSDPALSRAELSEALGVELAPDFGEVEVAESEQLLQLQSYVAAFDLALWLLPLATAVLVAITLWLAWDRARAALDLGLGTSLAAMLLILLVAWSVGRMGDATPPGAGGVMALAILESALSNLALWSALLGIAGLLVAVGAYAIGREV